MATKWIYIKQHQRRDGTSSRYQWDMRASFHDGCIRSQYGLTFEEALGVVAILLGDGQNGAEHARRMLKSKAQHEADRKRHEEAIANIADRVDAAPTDQRREPMLVGAVQLFAERLALKGDAVFAYKICEEAGVEPPANVKREIEGDAA